MTALVDLRAWTDANALWLWLATLLLGVAVTAGYVRQHASETSGNNVLAAQGRILAAALGCTVVFVALAAAHPSSAMQSFDHALGDGLAAGAGLRDIARWITLLGQPGFLAVALGIALLALLASRRSMAALMLALLALANGLAVRTFKAVFERVRPAQAEVFALGGDWSFPSGHAAGAMMVFGALGWIAADAFPVARRRLAGLAILLVIAVGASRVVLDVHHASDVLAGFTLGVAHLGALIAMTRAIEARVS